MVEQGIFVAVEVHNYSNYGATVRQLIEMGIPIQRAIILGYYSNSSAKDGLNDRDYKRRPNEIPAENNIGFVPPEALDELFANTEPNRALHIIVNGAHYLGCHKTAVESILHYQRENRIDNVSYHFIADKIRIAGTSLQGLQKLLRDFDFEYTDNLNYDITYRPAARELGFTPVLFIDGVLRYAAQGEDSTVGFYYWTNSGLFKKNLESLLI